MIRNIQWSAILAITLSSLWFMANASALPLPVKPDGVEDSNIKQDVQRRGRGRGGFRGRGGGRGGFRGRRGGGARGFRGGGRRGFRGGRGYRGRGFRRGRGGWRGRGYRRGRGWRRGWLGGYGYLPYFYGGYGYGGVESPDGVLCRSYYDAAIVGNTERLWNRYYFVCEGRSVP